MQFTMQYKNMLFIYQNRTEIIMDIVLNQEMQTKHLNYTMY